MAEVFEVGFNIDVKDKGTEDVAKDLKNVTKEVADVGESFKRLDELMSKLKSSSSDAFPALEKSFEKIKTIGETLPDFTKISAWGNYDTLLSKLFDKLPEEIKASSDALDEVNARVKLNASAYKDYSDFVKDASAIFKVFADNEKSSIEQNRAAISQRIEQEKQELAIAKERYETKIKEYNDEYTAVQRLKAAGSDSNGMYTVGDKLFSNEDLKKHLDNYKENVAELKKGYQEIEASISRETNLLQQQYPQRLKLLEQIGKELSTQKSIADINSKNFLDFAKYTASEVEAADAKTKAAASEKAAKEQTVNLSKQAEEAERKAAEAAKQEAVEAERIAKADAARESVRKQLLTHSQQGVSLAKQESEAQTKSAEATQKSAQVTATSMKQAEDSTNKTKEATSKLAEEQKKVADSASVWRNWTIKYEDIDKASEKIREFNEYIAKGDESQPASLMAFGQLVTTIDEAKQHVNTLQNAIANAVNAEAVKNGLQKTKDKEDEIDESVKKRVLTEKEYADVVEDTKGKLEKASGVIEDLGDKQLKMWSDIDDKLREVLTDIIDIGSEYEYMVAKMHTVYEATNTDIKKQSDELIAVSNKYGIAAKDLAQAGYDAIAMAADSQGMSDRLTDFEDTISRLSIASFTDLTTIVDVLTTAMNTYGYSVEDADKLSNQLLYTQNKGKTSIKELKSALNTLSGPASLVGISFEELQAALAAITSSGIKTSQAASGLQTAFNNILKPTDDAIEVAKELGIEFDSTAIKAKGLHGVLEDIFNSGATDDQLNTLFGSSRAQKAIRELVSERGLGVMEEALNDLLTQTTETLDNAFEIMEDTSKLRWEKIQNVFDNIKITAFEKMADKIEPILESLQEDVEDLFDRLNDGEFDEFFNSLTDILTSVYGLVKEIVETIAKPSTAKALSGVVDMWSKMLDVLSRIIDALDNMGLTDKVAGFMTLATAVSMMSAGFSGLSKGISAIGSIASGLQTAGAAAYNLVGNMSMITSGAVEASTILGTTGVTLSGILATVTSILPIVIAIGSAIAIWSKATKEAEENLAKYREENEKQLGESEGRINRLKEAWDAALEAEDKYFNRFYDENDNVELPGFNDIEENRKRIESYIDTLNTLVMTDGTIIGDEEEVNRVVSALNSTFGTHIEVVDGAVKNWETYEEYLRNSNFADEVTKKIEKIDTELANIGKDAGQLELDVKFYQGETEKAKKKLTNELLGMLDDVASDIGLSATIQDKVYDAANGAMVGNLGVVKSLLDETFKYFAKDFDLTIEQWDSAEELLNTLIEKEVQLGNDTTVLENIRDIAVAYDATSLAAARVTEASDNLGIVTDLTATKAELLEGNYEGAAEKLGALINRLEAIDDASVNLSVDTSGLSEAADVVDDTKDRVNKALSSLKDSSSDFKSSFSDIVSDLKEAKKDAQEAVMDTYESVWDAWVSNMTDKISVANKKITDAASETLSSFKKLQQENTELISDVLSLQYDKIKETLDKEYDDRKQYYADELEALSDNYEEQKKLTEDKYESERKAAEEAHNEVMSGIEEERDARLKAISDVQKERKRQSYVDDITKLEAEIAKYGSMENLATSSDRKALASLLEKLEDARGKLEDYDISEREKAEQEAIKAEYEAKKNAEQEAYEQKKDNIKELEEAEKEADKSTYETNKQNLTAERDAELAALKEKNDAKLKLEKEYLDSLKKLYAEAQGYDLEAYEAAVNSRKDEALKSLDNIKDIMNDIKSSALSGAKDKQSQEYKEFERQLKESSSSFEKSLSNFYDTAKDSNAPEAIQGIISETATFASSAVNDIKSLSTAAQSLGIDITKEMNELQEAVALFTSTAPTMFDDLLTEDALKSFMTKGNTFKSAITTTYSDATSEVVKFNDEVLQKTNEFTKGIESNIDSTAKGLNNVANAVSKGIDELEAQKSRLDVLLDSIDLRTASMMGNMSLEDIYNAQLAGVAVTGAINSGILNASMQQAVMSNMQPYMYYPNRFQDGEAGKVTKCDITNNFNVPTVTPDVVVETQRQNMNAMLNSDVFN